MNEWIETDNWKILFKQPTDKPLDESYIELIFRLKSDPRGVSSIKAEDLEDLQEDIKDLGKWRNYKKFVQELKGGKND